MHQGSNGLSICGCHGLARRHLTSRYMKAEKQQAQAEWGFQVGKETKDPGLLRLPFGDLPPQIKQSEWIINNSQKKDHLFSIDSFRH